MQQPPEVADSWWSPLQNPKPDYSEIGLESVSWVGSCIIAAAIIQEPWTHDADSDPISDHETSPINQIESPLSSKWPIYINEALDKSRSKLSYICCQQKHSGKINDTWTTQMVISCLNHLEQNCLPWNCSWFEQIQTGHQRMHVPACGLIR